MWGGIWGESVVSVIKATIVPLILISRNVQFTQQQQMEKQMDRRGFCHHSIVYDDPDRTPAISSLGTELFSHLKNLFASCKFTRTDNKGTNLSLGGCSSRKNALNCDVRIKRY